MSSVKSQSMRPPRFVFSYWGLDDWMDEHRDWYEAQDDYFGEHLPTIVDDVDWWLSLIEKGEVEDDGRSREQLQAMIDRLAAIDASFVPSGKPQQKPPRPSSSKSGFVYLFRFGDTTYYKIGVSVDVENRRKSIDSSSPLPIHMEACLYSESPYQLEKALHRALDQYRRNGEWFELSPCLADAFMGMARDLDRGMEVSSGN